MIAVLQASFDKKPSRSKRGLPPRTKVRKAEHNAEMRRHFAVKIYLEAFAARMASIIIGTTLNRSPQMP